MDSERIKEVLAKIPVIPVLLLWCLKLGYDFYSFQNDASSPLQLKQQELSAAKGDLQKLDARVKQVVEFKKNLELKKVELRNITQELESMRATISENLDLPDFMRTTLTEARKVGLTVLSLKPTTAASKEFYAEQAFELVFRGAYVQLVVFLERLASMQKIVRTDSFSIKPTSLATSRFVELEGTISVKAYRYLGSKADELAKSRKEGS